MEQPIIDKPVSIDDLVAYLERNPWIEVEHSNPNDCGMRKFLRFERGKLMFKLLEPRLNEGLVLTNLVSVPLPGLGCAMSQFMSYGFCDDGFEAVMTIPNHEPMRVFFRYAEDPI